MVRLDIRGHQFQVDLDGVRNTRKSARPAGTDPEAWKILGPHRERLRKAAARDKNKGPQPQVAPVEEPDEKTETLEVERGASHL